MNRDFSVETTLTCPYCDAKPNTVGLSVDKKCGDVAQLGAIAVNQAWDEHAKQLALWRAKHDACLSEG